MVGGMPRLARVMAPGLPHHATQPGSRRIDMFLCEDDYPVYLDLMAQWCKHRPVAIWPYCLMPNHVHVIAVPETAEGLCRGVGEAHRRYTRHVNFRQGWRVHLWQGRFASFVIDEPHLLIGIRYVELNPVKVRGLPNAPRRIVGAAPAPPSTGRTMYWCKCNRCWVLWAPGRHISPWMLTRRN